MFIGISEAEKKPICELEKGWGFNRGLEAKRSGERGATRVMVDPTIPPVNTHWVRFVNAFRAQYTLSSQHTHQRYANCLQGAQYLLNGLASRS